MAKLLVMAMFAIPSSFIPGESKSWFDGVSAAEFWPNV
jgi:hypothetical protein